jgi:hypothetical protein
VTPVQWARVLHAGSKATLPLQTETDVGTVLYTALRAMEAEAVKIAEETWMTCPDQDVCSRLGGICQCVEETQQKSRRERLAVADAEAERLAALMGDEWADGMYP